MLVEGRRIRLAPFGVTAPSHPAQTALVDLTVKSLAIGDELVEAMTLSKC